MSEEQLPIQDEILEKVVKRTNVLVYASTFIVIVAMFNIMAPDTAERFFGETEEVLEPEIIPMAEDIPDDLIENGIHMRTGLIVDDGFEQVKVTCLACHSAKLVTQNRADRDGWKKMIRWMQETQNLWDLGPNEDIILDYLAKNYAPEQEGRRANLKDIEWYVLED
ncbi:hypothetical protein [Sanyastnella coralliicola]|uniref:hypothetical protein n=1 Tax=Sanyastnella coralliicola TaxID=3069118 RepID=UPI0027B96A92|nr:hypothetical protein [Longitalea sp. SCSIO 12813]